ncbi:MAG: RHS repeat domain-containing protein [Bacteroidota bacterium]
MGILTLLPCHAQDSLQTIIPPSPEAAAFEKYGDIAVSAYTGTPDISIPLTSVRSKEVSAAFSLSYHASGIRVDEEASWVGLGWVLNGGGVISRNIIGKDDFRFYHKDSLVLDDFESELTSFHKIQAGCELVGKRERGKPIQKIDLSEFVSGYAIHDFEPDVYSFNFQGYSGKFILTRDLEVVFQSPQKIEFKVIGNGDAWQVRTPDGFTYTFGTQEREWTTDSPEHEKPITSWYLDKVGSPYGNSISFKYKQTQLPTLTLGSFFEKRVAIDDCELGSPSSILPPNLSARRVYTTVVMDSVIFDTGYLVFESAMDRLDLENAHRLKAIHLYYRGDFQQNIPARTWTFSHDYFVGGENDRSGGKYEKKLLSHRLKLLAVQESGGSLSVPPYKFHYFEGGAYHDLPAKTSFARDHWGYYNGRKSNHSLIPGFFGYIDLGTTTITEIKGANREARFPYSQAYTLKQITYPTGGHTEFRFEGHTFDNDSSLVNDLSRILETEVDSVQSFFQTYGARETENVLDLSDLYYQPATGEFSKVRVRASFRFKGQVNIPFEQGHAWWGLFDEDGNAIKIVDISQADFLGPSFSLKGNVVDYQTILSLPAGTYTWKGSMDTYGASIIGDINSRFHYQVALEDTDEPFVQAGGLRIKEVIVRDGEERSEDQLRMYEYHYREDRDRDGKEEEYSEGRSMSRPLYWGFENYFFVRKHEYGTTTEPCLAFVATSQSHIPLNSTSGGSIVGYDQVSIFHGVDKDGTYGTFGKTTLTYLNQPDTILDYKFLRPAGIPNLQVAGNGLLISSTDYKNESGQFIPLQKTYNTYKRTPSAYDIVYGIRHKESAVFGGDEVNIHPCHNSVLAIYPALKSVWYPMVSSTQITYNQKGVTDSVSILTNYVYDNHEHFQLTSQHHSSSSGEQFTTRYYYPLDYEISNTGSFIHELKRQHRHASPVETHVFRDGKLTEGVFRSYNWKSGNLLPHKIYASELVEPEHYVNDLTLESPDKEIFTERFVFDAYDERGSLLEQYPYGHDVPSSYIWGYSSSVPLAEVVGASHQDIAFTSFEELPGEGNLLGNWKLAKGSIIGNGGKAGSKLLLSGSITFSPNTQESYAVSYWRNGELVEMLKSGPITLYAPLDEARAHPLGAFMTTYTYDNQLRLIASSDENHSYTFYAYDDLGRLIEVKDLNRNLLGTQTYHYKDK